MKARSRRNHDSPLLVTLLLFSFIGLSIWWIKKELDRSPKQLSQSEKNTLRRLRSGFLTYTVHGDCRMKCRNVSRSEIKQILSYGSYNPAKSSANRYVIDADVNGRSLTAIFGYSSFVTYLITVIDTGYDWPCPRC